MEYALETRGLSKKYGKFQALNGVDIHVPKGSIYGFVGKNGAGKTTLIRLICGLQEPSAGEYFLYGVSSRDRRIWTARGRVGAVVETPSVYLDLTAEDNLKAQYRVLGMPSDRGIEELLDLVGLRGTGNKKAGHFSLGMRQRLGIAIALAGNPDFLVLDEPTNGLDPEGIVELRELLIRLNREMQITILISSHILEELSKLATHYGFIDRGRVLRETTAQEIAKVSRKCIQAEVSDTKVLGRVLDRLHIDYRLSSDTEALIYGDIPITTMVVYLAKEGCRVNRIFNRDEDLETFFINMVGGGDHA